MTVVEFRPMIDTMLSPEVIQEIEDPFDRYEAATRAVESAQALIAELQKVKAKAVVQAVERSGSQRKAADRLGLTQPNVNIYVKAARLGVSQKKARYGKI